MVRDLSNLHIDELEDFYNNLSEVQKMIFNVGSGSASNLVHLHISYDPSLAGATITATNGSEVKTAVADSTGLTVINCTKLGEWTITEDKTNISVTVTAIYYGEYSMSLALKPNGATVTPTNNIQTWLKCAELNKSYTSMSEVLADTNTLSALISDNNASDYLVRSTTWASDVCSNESAMTYIGLNDYCANKLLADSTWLEAICNSPHFEKVLTVKIPTMTSNTAPSGEAFGSQCYDNTSTYTWYKAMDKDDNTCWHSIGNLSTAQLGYDFGKQVIVKKILLKNRNDSSTTSAPKTFSLEGYNGTSYVKIQDFTNDNNNKGAETTYIVNNDESYSKYRLNITSSYSSSYVLGELQFYGREEA